MTLVALARIVTRCAHSATTATGSIDESGREKGCKWANVVWNHTPLDYRIDYEIYPNKRCITEDPEKAHALPPGYCLLAEQSQQAQDITQIYEKKAGLE